MPLLDHFHEPIKSRLRYDSLHSGWATYLASNLVEHWLPASYVAVEHSHLGPRVEIDVATYDKGEQGAAVLPNGGTVATRPRTWTAPSPLATVSVLFPDEFEVLVFADSGGWELVGAIELVSPGNKDRPDECRAFLAKCASYIHRGVSLVLIDVVTTRQANLHNDLLDFLGARDAGRLPDDAPLYAAAYRPVLRQERCEMDVWAERCQVGSPLPTMPLHLPDGLVVPVEFEVTYQEICRRRRVI